MTDNSQLVKRLRKDVFYGDERMHKMHLHNPLHMEAANAIEALEARVAELEAGLREITDACEADCGVPDADDEDDETVGSGLEADGVTIRPMALTFGILRRARALLERSPS